MNKHRHSIVFLLISGLLFCTSCLKKDGPDTTIFYGHQQIPDINEYMPQRLLKAFGNANLHFGDNPPKIDTCFVSDAIQIDSVALTPDSLWLAQYHDMPYILGFPQYFRFFDQHVGIAKINFYEPKENGYNPDLNYIEQSSTDNTYAVVNSDLNHFVDDTSAPIYFKNGSYKAKDFNYVYIMGTDPYFTAYYYEIRDIITHYQPLCAVIISGKKATIPVIGQDGMVTQQPVIVDFKLGYEYMTYYHPISGDLLDDLQVGAQPYPGNMMILSCDTLHVGQYQP